MAIARREPLVPMTDNALDHRPASRWRQVVDPDARTSMRVIIERIAVGDGIPPHAHSVDEVVLIEAGHGSLYLDGEDIAVRAGDVVFVPARAIHGLVNRGRRPLAIRAVYPSRQVDIEFVAR